VLRCSGHAKNDDVTTPVNCMYTMSVKFYSTGQGPNTTWTGMGGRKETGTGTSEDGPQSVWERAWVDIKGAGTGGGHGTEIPFPCRPLEWCGGGRNGMASNL